jgi:uncharacterized protein (DUF1501 family)
MTNRLKALDAMLAALRDGLGAAWAETTVLVATEFGRTAAANGTGGTDHGTASAAMLLGGGVDGGRVVSDWPGLAPSALYQGRDLQPTTGLDSLIQRGAADGLDIVAPYGEPAYARLRGALAIDVAAATRLDGLFALHPALVETAKLYEAKQALFVHAVASPYRERSHFDGQNVLETGGAAPHDVKDGWLNRLVGLLPRRTGEAIAIAPTVPLALRGPADVISYAPAASRQAPDELLQRVQQLYADDAQLHALWSTAMDARAMATPSPRQSPADLGRLAASFLARPTARASPCSRAKAGTRTARRRCA